MDNLLQFLAAVVCHWVLLSMAVGAFLYSRYGDFDPDSKAVPGLILVAIGCILLTLYLTATEPLTAPIQQR